MPDCQLLCVHLLLRSAIHLNPFSRSNMINSYVLSLNSPRYIFRKFLIQQLAASVLLLREYVLAQHYFSRSNIKIEEDEILTHYKINIS